MRISGKYLTIIICVTLGLLASIISFLTEMMIFIPIFYGLGFPLVNIDKPLKQKLGLTLVIIIVSTIIFGATIFTSIIFDFDKYFFPGLVAGIAGVLFLGINALLIKKVKINVKTALFTFILSGLSLPIYIILKENKAMVNNELFRQFGSMIFWMTMTTIGISSGIDDKQTSNRNSLI